jgi:ABC-type nitrate/sulfonate/bicarbonate transport system substrate-binding protein
MTQPPLETLWYTRCQVPTPFSFAAQFGWFEQEFAPDGIAVKSLRETSNVEELASHFEHSLPNSFRQGGSVPAIWARAKGQDTRVIALTWTDEHQAIIALPSSGIRSAADLRGRRIGIPKHAITIDHNRASALRAFELVLEHEGVPRTDVELIDLEDEGADAAARMRDYGRS